MKSSILEPKKPKLFVNELLSLDERLVNVIHHVTIAAENLSLRVFLIGGVVRDILLKYPVSDLDILVEGDAIKLARHLSECLNLSIRTYKPFHTATLFWSDGYRVDFAATRSEEYIHPGALPKVCPSGLSEDIVRRDFTINAMAISINRKDFGRLIDLCGGEADLRKKKIKVFHPNSFIDDPTRILRAVRFEQRFRFAMDSDTVRYLREAVKKNVFSSVKPPRIFAEFTKSLQEINVSTQLARLTELTKLKFIPIKSRGKLMAVNRVACCLNRKNPSRINFDSNDLWKIYLLALLYREKNEDILLFIKKGSEYIIYEI